MNTHEIRLEFDKAEGEKAEVFDVMYGHFSDMLAEIDDVQAENKQLKAIIKSALDQCPPVAVGVREVLEGQND